MADAHPPDAILVERAQGGDRQAQEAIYRRHVRYIAGMAQRLLRDHSDAEDVVQDAFVIAHQQLASLRDGAALRGWLAQIAVSQVRRKLRRRRLLRFFGLDRSTDDASLPELASESASPD